LDKLLNDLIAYLEAQPMDTVDGQVNYCFTRILHSGAYPQSYFDFNRAMGVLESVKQEFYRRKVAPYEDTKIAENGDIVGARSDVPTDADNRAREARAAMKRCERRGEDLP
jgi:hypothetical protein